MRRIQGRSPNSQGQYMLDPRDLSLDLAKFDDEIFIKEGFRKEHIDNAIKKFGIDKEERDGTSREEEESLNAFQRPAVGGLKFADKAPESGPAPQLR